MGLQSFKDFGYMIFFPSAGMKINFSISANLWYASQFLAAVIDFQGLKYFLTFRDFSAHINRLRQYRYSSDIDGVTYTESWCKGDQI